MLGLSSIFFRKCRVILRVKFPSATTTLYLLFYVLLDNACYPIPLSQLSKSDCEGLLHRLVIIGVGSFQVACDSEYIIRLLYAVSSVVCSVSISASIQFHSERAVYFYNSGQFSFVLSKIQSEIWTKKCLLHLPWLYH
jgi:hypothetical protein